MSQFSLLFANAWRRFARFDGWASDSDPRAVLALAAIIFAAPGIMLAFYLSFPAVVGFHFRMIDARPVLNELAYYSGLLVALAALLEWDALLPDAADVAVLAPLPVRPGRLVAAHGAALAALLAALALAVNAPSLLLMPLIDATGEAFLAGVARQTAAVVITAAIAFSSVLALQSLIAGCAGFRGLRKIGPAAQLAGLVGVVAALLLVPGLSELGPAWRHGFESPLPLAGWAAGIALAASALYILAARRAFRPELHARGRGGRTQSRWLWGGSASRAAVARFALLALARCRRQRIIVGAWFAVGAAVVLKSTVSLVSRRAAPEFAEIARVALSVPLVLTFFLLAGLRHSFVVPAELRANWLFRLCSGGHTGDWTAGGRWLMGEYLAVLLLPAAGFAFWLWPAHAAWAQLAFLAVAGAAWIQCLTWNLRKIPFTCSYQPGGANVNYAWPFYAVGFGVGGFALGGWEQWLLEDWRRLALALAGMLAALAWSERRRRRDAAEFGCVFEDDPDPAVQTLLAN